MPIPPGTGIRPVDHEQGDPQHEGDREQDLRRGNRDLQSRNETQEESQRRDLQFGGAVVGVREDTHGREILSASRVVVRDPDTGY